MKARNSGEIDAGLVSATATALPLVDEHFHLLFRVLLLVWVLVGRSHISNARTAMKTGEKENHVEVHDFVQMVPPSFLGFAFLGFRVQHTTNPMFQLARSPLSELSVARVKCFVSCRPFVCPLFSVRRQFPPQSQPRPISQRRQLHQRYFHLLQHRCRNQFPSPRLQHPPPRLLRRWCARLCQAARTRQLSPRPPRYQPPARSPPPRGGFLLLPHSLYQSRRKILSIKAVISFIATNHPETTVVLVAVQVGKIRSMACRTSQPHTSQSQDPKQPQKKPRPTTTTHRQNATTIA